MTTLCTPSSSRAPAKPMELQPIYKRPGHGTKGRDISLLMNWFRLARTMKNQKMTIYEFDVVISKRYSSREGQVTKEIKDRENARKWFWNAVRSLTNFFKSEYEMVYNDRDTAWTITKLPDNRGGTKTMKDPDPNKRTFYDISLAFREEFVFDINSEDIAIANRSREFLKCLVTQRTRYAPAENNRREWDFTRKWESFGGGVFGVPNHLTHVEYRELKVSPGVRAWLGLYAAVRSLENRDSVINFGLVNKLFYSMNMNLVDLYAEVICGVDGGENWEQRLADYGMNSRQCERLSKKITGLRVKSPLTEGGIGALIRKPKWQPKGYKGPVVYERPYLSEQHFRVVGVHNQTAITRPIGSVTVEKAYYLLGKPLKFPNLPLVIVQQGQKTPDYQPMEVLFVHDTPQKYTGFLDFADRLRYVRGVTRKPDEYKRLTDAMLKEMEMNGPEDHFLRQFQMSLNTDWTSCRGRVLDAPVVRDGHGQAKQLDEDRAYRVSELNVTPPEVVFGVAMMYCQETGYLVLAGGNTDEHKQEAKKKVGKFYRELMKRLPELGITVSKEPPQVYEAQAFSEKEVCRHSIHDVKPMTSLVEATGMGNREVPTISKVADIEKRRFALLNKDGNKSYILLIIHDRVFKQYGRVKHACDTEVGIASQVINRESIDAVLRDEQGSNGLLYSLGTKINAKLGGTNMTVDMPDSFEEKLKECPVMYVGIDVTHPSPGSEIDISLASMVGSSNLEGTQYSSRIYAQMVSKETVECFDFQFTDLMIEFSRENGMFPKHVIVYRDGVSDSQMRLTAYLEIKWIRDSWARLSEGACEMPTITYIVVQKRHVTRFIQPKLNPDGSTTYTNMPSGTVVDKDVVSPTMFDFYLASQHGAIGTTRPAHYTVVYDEWERSPDQIHELTYRLCFLYARCRKPVSLPTPVYYAHLACEKAKEWYKHAVKSGRIIPRTETDGDALISDKKRKIEEQLTSHNDLPGMHFV